MVDNMNRPIVSRRWWSINNNRQ